jgi:RNA polymerase sigma-70 factor (ECF subfamily)
LTDHPGFFLRPIFAHILSIPLHYIVEADQQNARVGGFALNLNSETKLVEAAQNGHLESFAALYRRYYSVMVALACAVLSDAHLAEDAAQETFAIACRDLPNLRRKDKFAAWLAGICRNLARQMRRRENRSVAGSVQQPGRNPDGKDNRTDAIRRVVWQLRPAERELVVLRYYDNMPYEQIAFVLGISAGAVNGRLIRAKRKIANYLIREGFMGDDYERP